MSLKNRMIGLAAVSAAALAAAAPLASAKTTVVANTTPLPSTSTCAAQVFTPALAAFGDVNAYSLAPQGSFEGAIDGWTISGTSKIVADPGFAGGPAADTASLQIAAGASATSPLICANANTPTFRLFQKAAVANAGASRMDVTYLDATQAISHASGTFTPSRAWAPTAPLRISTNHIAVDSTGWGFIQITITAPSNSAMRIDDLYIDPRMH